MPPTATTLAESALLLLDVNRVTPSSWNSRPRSADVVKVACPGDFASFGLENRSAGSGAMLWRGVCAQQEVQANSARSGTKLPDRAIVDISYPGPSGSGCKILYVTSYPDEVPVRGALRRTVLGALTKDVSPENLVAAVRLVASGVSLLAPEFIRQSAAGGQSLVDWLADPREREVFRLVQAGATNAQIAEELNMSASWVKQTISALCRRFGVKGRAALAANSGDALVDHGVRN